MSVGHRHQLVAESRVQTPDMITGVASAQLGASFEWFDKSLMSLDSKSYLLQRSGSFLMSRVQIAGRGSMMEQRAAPRFFRFYFSLALKTEFQAAPGALNVKVPTSSLPQFAIHYMLMKCSNLLFFFFSKSSCSGSTSK
jgi:hypothetical protein